MIRRFAALAAFGAALVVTGLGCGSGLNTVEVKVTLDGSPVPGAMVSFASDSGKSAVGQTDANGIAKLNMVNAKPGKTGVEAGTYTVTFEKPEIPEYMQKVTDPMAAMKKDMDERVKKGIGNPGMGPAAGGAKGGEAAKRKNLLPDKYASPKTSGFTVNVPADTSGVKEFPLASK